MNASLGMLEVSLTICVCTGPPKAPVKERVCISTDNPAACASTVKVTGITSGSIAPGAVTVIDPVLVPIDRFAGLTATVMLLPPSVEPVCGPTASQLPEALAAV